MWELPGHQTRVLEIHKKTVLMVRKHLKERQKCPSIILTNQADRDSCAIRKASDPDQKSVHLGCVKKAPRVGLKDFKNV